MSLEEFSLLRLALDLPNLDFIHASLAMTRLWVRGRLWSSAAYRRKYALSRAHETTVLDLVNSE